MIFEEILEYALKEKPKLLNPVETVDALVLATRAMHQANDEGYELVQEPGVSQEMGFHEGLGGP